MDKRVGTLNQMFNVLFREQERAWTRLQLETSLLSPACKTYQQLLPSCPPVNEREIEAWLAPGETIDVNFASHNKFLYLPPLEKNTDFVPVMQMRCILNEEQTDVSLRVMFVRNIGDGNRLGGLGFRLESGAGRHDFYHAQLIRDFGRGQGIEGPEWLPETQPSFPLAAKCPVTLILCLLLSLYGKKYCWAFVNEHQIFKLQSYLNEIDNWYNG